jgi:RNA polymerase sigma-70 factor (ECF subfamily)
METENKLEELSDNELVDAINEGDEGAFEALYYRYRDWAVHLAFRWTGNRELALDVLQETFFSFAKRFPGFRLTARLQTFLYPVIRNIAISARRKHERYDLDDSKLQNLCAPASSPTKAAADQELQAVLEGLGQGHRDVLILRFVDGLSLEEIADVLGVPLGTVKSRLHNALTTLRKDERTKQFFDR